MNISDFDLGWLAGIIEGEGYIGINENTNQTFLRVSMTDEDVIRSLIEKTGLGHVNGPYRYDDNKKFFWIWSVMTRDDLSDLLYLILPFMGERRSCAIKEALEVIEVSRDRELYRLQFFICDHPRTKENTKENRRCRTCVNTGKRERYSLNTQMKKVGI